jgi:WD40 repeat protein
MRELQKPFGILCCLFVPVLACGILVGSSPRVVRAHDERGPVAGESRRLDHPGVGRVAFSEDGRRILSGSDPTLADDRKEVPSDCSVRTWDPTTGKQLSESVLPKAGRIIDFSPDGRQGLSTTLVDNAGERDALLQVWEISTGKELRKSVLPKGRPFLAVTPGWRSYLSLDGEDSGVLQLRDRQSGQELRRFEGHKGLVEAISFSRDGRRLLSGGHDQTVRLWDVASGKELRRLEGHKDRVNSVAFSSDGRRGVSGGGNYNSPRAVADSSVRVWDLESGKELRRFYEGEDAAVMHVAISPDGRRAISIGSFSIDSPSDPTIRVWDVETGRLLRRFTADSPSGLAGIFAHLVISPDGRYALTANMDGTVRLWELP